MALGQLEDLFLYGDVCQQDRVDAHREMPQQRSQLVDFGNLLVFRRAHNQRTLGRKVPQVRIHVLQHKGRVDSFFCSDVWNASNGSHESAELGVGVFAWGMLHLVAVGKGHQLYDHSLAFIELSPHAFYPLHGVFYTDDPQGPSFGAESELVTELREVVTEGRSVDAELLDLLLDERERPLNWLQLRSYLSEGECLLVEQEQVVLEFLDVLLLELLQVLLEVQFELGDDVLFIPLALVVAQHIAQHNAKLGVQLAYVSADAVLDVLEQHAVGGVHKRHVMPKPNCILQAVLSQCAPKRLHVAQHVLLKPFL